MFLMAGRKFAGKSSLDGHISRIKDRYFPAKKPKFKKIYSSIKKLKKDGEDLIERGPSSKLHLIYMSIMNQLNKGHASSSFGESYTREIETYIEEISSRTIEAYTIIDQSEEGSGYNSVDSYPSSALSDLDASRDEHTSLSAASSHLISSIGTTSLSSHPQLFRRVDFNSSQASFSTAGDLGFTHSSSEAKFLDKDQEVPLNTFDELVDDLDGGSNHESFYALSIISDFLDIDNSFLASQGVNDDFRHGATQNEDQSCDSFASRENLESYLDFPDAELFSVENTNQYVREILKATLNNSKDTFFMRKASPGSVCDSQFSELEVPEHLNLPLGVTIENHCEPLNFTKTEKENVDGADNTPCGPYASEDVFLPEPAGTPELLGASNIAEEPWQERPLRTSKEWKANMIQWIAKSFPSSNISVNDEIETESPGPAPVTSPDVCPVFVSTNREVDGALWDGDRPSSSHLLGGSANEIEAAEDVRYSLPGMTHETSASHNTGAGAHFCVPAAWPHETFLQHSSTSSQERCYSSFPGFTRSFSQFSTKYSSHSMPSFEKRNVCKLLQRSGGRAKAKFKRSFSEPLAREQREPAVVILPRAEERPEEVFLPVLEVYSTLHPPQQVPRVDNHGPILQESLSDFLDDIDQSELDHQIQHALDFGIPLPSDVDVNEPVIDIRASKRMLRLSRL